MIRRLLQLIPHAALLAVLALLFASVQHLVAPPLPWSADWTLNAYVRASEEGFQPLSLSELRALLDSSSPPALADARPPRLYDVSHIPSAINLPAGSVEESLSPHVAVLDPSAPIVVYCDGLDCADSLDAARTLRSLGFSSISLFPDGFSAWQAAALPLEAAP